MAKLSKNYDLVKPEVNDYITPQIFSDNFDIIDSEIHNVNSALSTEINKLKPQLGNYNLQATTWAADNTYTINNANITATSYQEVLPGAGITVDQLKALQKANFQDGGQSDGTLKIKAYGTKPTINIPIRIIFRK